MHQDKDGRLDFAVGDIVALDPIPAGDEVRRGTDIWMRSEDRASGRFERIWSAEGSTGDTAKMGRRVCDTGMMRVRVTNRTFSGSFDFEVISKGT